MKLVCWLLWLLTFGLLGHRWCVVRTNMQKSLALGHLHLLAGRDAVCLRCSAKWSDADYVLPEPPIVKEADVTLLGLPAVVDREMPMPKPRTLDLPPYLAKAMEGRIGEFTQLPPTPPPPQLPTEEF